MVHRRGRRGKVVVAMLSRRQFLPFLALRWLAAPAFGQQNAMPPVTTLLFGGDVMLSRNVAQRARAQKDPAWPFRKIAPLFAAADIACINLESPFSDKGAIMTKGMIFKTEPDMIAGLELAGIDLVSTANNHARDRGSYGLEYTLDHLAAHKIQAVGTAKVEEDAHAGVVIERNGVRFGFLAYTYDANNGNYRDTDPRIAVLDIDRMHGDVDALKPSCDAIIVAMHAGIEYQPKPNKQQTTFARAAIDAGAAAVIGHHPHVRQPWEWYKQAPIFYSLGNFIFDQFQRKETQIGSIAELVFEGPRLTRARLRTVNIVLTVPQLADEPEPAFSAAP